MNHGILTNPSSMKSQKNFATSYLWSTKLALTPLTAGMFLATTYIVRSNTFLVGRETSLTIV